MKRFLRWACPIMAMSLLVSACATAPQYSEHVNTLENASPVQNHVQNQPLHFHSSLLQPLHKTATIEGLPMHPSPAVTQLDFVTRAVGFAINDRGGLEESVDGGRHFRLQNKMPGLPLQSLSAVGSKTLFAVASTADEQSSPSVAQKLLYSEDSGVHWTTLASVKEKASPTAFQVQPTLQIVSSDRGFATFAGELLTGHPVKSHWHSIAIPHHWAVLSSYFFNDRQGVILATPRLQKNQPLRKVSLYRTTDGGHDWTYVRAFGRSAHTLDNVFLCGTPNGQVWVLFQSLYSMSLWIAHSSDGGIDFSLQKAPSVGAIHHVIPSTVDVTSAVAGAHGRLYITTASAQSAGGIAVLSQGGKQVLSSDGWRSGWEMTDIDRVGVHDWMATGNTLLGESLILHATHATGPWQQLSPAMTPTRQIDFISANVGFGLGNAMDPNALLSTANGGQTWSVVTTSSGPYARQPFHKIDTVRFLSRQIGWMEVDTWTQSNRTPSVSLWMTHTGGVSWQPISMQILPHAMQQEAQSGNLLFLHNALEVFSKNRLLLQIGGFPTYEFRFSDNGGKTTHAFFTGRKAPASWASVSFPQPENGYLLTTTNRDNLPRAQLYQIRPKMTATRLYRWKNDVAGEGLSFPQPQIGYALLAKHPFSEHPLFLLERTTDGGRTWSVETFPPTVTFPPIANRNHPELQFINQMDGWILTSDGIWRTTDGGIHWTFLGGA